MKAPNLSLVALLSVFSISSAFQTLSSNGLLRSRHQSQLQLQTALNSENDNNVDSTKSNRRSFMKNLVLGTVGSVIATSSPNAALAADDLVDVYFGVGCYWHIQHEFVEAERKLLGRGDAGLTSRTGYAGGKETDKEGRVCYHNFMGVADYGKYGHGEVVGMKIPQSSIGDFAKEYFDLFTAKGERVDPMDRGGEYRALLGLPNGANNQAYPAVEAAATAKGMTLAMGKGNDPDTLGQKKVFVYDTAKFPFYQAEVYHQFHNDFQSPAYGKKYNDLQTMAFNDGRVKITGCPDKV